MAQHGRAQRRAVAPTARRGRWRAASTASTASSAARPTTSRRRSWSRTTRSSITTCYRDGYYCTDDWTDKAIGWLKDAREHVAGQAVLPLRRAQRAARAAAREGGGSRALLAARSTPDGTRCAPQRVARQVAQGLFARAAGAAAAQPRRARVGRRSMPARRALFARYMELYAAVVDNMDQNIGRLLAALRSARPARQHAGDPDLRQRRQRHRRHRGRGQQPVQAPDQRRGSGLGARDAASAAASAAPTSWPAYPLGWTDVSSAPFRLYKTTTMNGGIRVPLVVQWPARLRDGGRGPAPVGARDRHRADRARSAGRALPGQRSPAVARARMDGVSFRAALERRGDAPAPRHAQHYELAGNRGYIADGWKIVSLQPPGKPIDLATGCCSISRTIRRRRTTSRRAQPRQARGAGGRLRRGCRRELRVSARQSRRAPLADGAAVPRGVAGRAAHVLSRAPAPPRWRSWRRWSPTATTRSRATFTYDAGDNGVVFALGDPIAGMALYRARRRADVLLSRRPGRTAACDRCRCATGDNRFELAHRALGARRGAGTLRMNGAQVATLDMSPTTILGLGVGEGLDVGCDRRLHVTARYGGSGACAYTGSVAQRAHRAGAAGARQLRQSPGAARAAGLNPGLPRARTATR